MHNIKHLSDVGERGLILYDGREYYAVVEDKWRSLEKYTIPTEGDGPIGAVGDLVRLRATVATLAEHPASIFVDLDGFASLKSTEGSRRMAQEQPTRSLGGLPHERSVVLREAKSIVVVPESQWGEPINGDIAGDAKVLTYRGALAANIPQQDIPTGTFCVLVNFAELVRPST